jgi:DNA-binding Lrp family transcriptional regulator
MIKAYIFIITSPGQFVEARERIRQKWPEREWPEGGWPEGRWPEGMRALISSVHILTGFADLIVKVVTKDLPGLWGVVDSIAELEEVSKTMTLLASVPSETRAIGTDTQEKTTAFILIDGLPHKTKHIQSKLCEFEDIVDCDIVLGDYDIIIQTSVQLNQLLRYIKKIQKIDGVKKTVTSITASALDKCHTT